MNEALLIVPKADNAGHDLSGLRDSIAAELCQAFGGVTESDATGMWRDDAGKLYREPVTQLVSACEPTPANNATLRRLALQIGHEGNQLAVYCRYPNGRVEIVSTQSATVADNDNLPHGSQSAAL